MPRRTVVLCLVLFSSILSFAQLRNPFPKPEKAANVVREFCRLDYMGNRLSEKGWAQMKSLTTWTVNPDWRTFHVISRYDLTSENASLHSATIAMRYIPVGRFELGIGFTSMPDPEDVTFTVKETDDGWRIDDTDVGMVEPHISKAVAIQWLEAKLKTVTDPGEKISVQSALKQLQGK